jgi:dephospho-CoA kinase
LLRAGLTGGIGSGKSTAAAIFAEQGLAVIEADAVGRDLMRPGQPVFAAIVAHFGEAMVRPDGALDRTRLADVAFRQGRLAELNAIVHPAVIAAQEDWMRAVFDRDPQAAAVVESALIFEASEGTDASIPGWRERFDRIVLVTAPDELKIARYIERVLAREPDAGAERRAAIERDARARLARQIPDAQKLAWCHYVIDNANGLDRLREQAVQVASALRGLAAGALRENK